MNYKQTDKLKKTEYRIRRRMHGEQGGQKNKSTASTGSGFYYSFLTVVLLLCLFQVTVSAVLNISKVVSYKAKIVQITKSRDAAMTTNEQLKDNIKNFSNVTGLEAIARNNLKMSGEDEVLVIINSPKDEEIPVKQNKWKFWEDVVSN